MNERIQQLYLQAHEQKPIIVMDSETCEPTHKLGHSGVPMYHNVFDPEKFAELILTEVISTIYRSDISDKKQEKLVDELAYKFGMK